MSQRRRPARLLASLFLLPGPRGQRDHSRAIDWKESSWCSRTTRTSRSVVKEWTTRPEFISPLVDHLPKVAGIPSPKDVLGHHIGEPKKLTYYADILKYYRALAAATPRVKVVTIGKQQRRTRPGRRLRRRRRVDQEPRAVPHATSVSWPIPRTVTAAAGRARSSPRRSRSITCRAGCTAARSGRQRC